MSKKLTNEEFLKRLKEKNIKYIPLEEYKGFKVKIKWLCFENPKHIFESTPRDILNGHGCLYCSHQKVFVGETDLWTTHPEIAKMLKNPNDGYTLSAGSGKKVDWICPNCNSDIKMVVHNVIYRGICCQRCSDGISYSEKFVMSLLEQLNIDFEHNIPLDWSNNKRYDFYIEKYKMIIECHGLQHYEDKFKSYNSARTLSEEQENDRFKQNIAMLNGIEEYVVLDCRESNKKFISDSILNSRLSIIFNLSCVDWDMCDKNSHKSYYMDILKYYNDGIKNPIDIANKIGFDRSSVVYALHRLTENGLCDYNSKKSSIENSSAKRRKSVICLETGKIYKFMKHTVNDGFNDSAVSKCCTGHQEVHKGLHWMFYDDYLLLNEGVAT